MTFYYDTFPTPLGFFSAGVDEAGAIHAAVLGDFETLRARIRNAEWQKQPERLVHVAAALHDYWDTGVLPSTLELRPLGTNFQRAVWALLRQIPLGETRSYKNLANSLGNPKAARAVGAANGANPICLFIPCHRVIAADGSLAGFAFGEEHKRALLLHEETLVSSPRQCAGQTR